MYRHCPSAKTVSKAREDFPEPETPVMTVTRSWGMAREMFFRLFCLAPSIRSQRGCAIRSVLLRWKVYLSMHHPGNRTALTGLERAYRHRGDHREVFGRGWNLGNEEGILRAVHEAGPAALHGRTRSPRRSRGHRLPARRPPDQAGHRRGGAPSHPHPRRGLRTRRRVSLMRNDKIERKDVLNFFE